MLVYVLNADGYPLIPSSRCAHIRHLLKAGRAKVVRQKPFTIQLCYETTNYTQPLCGGTDPGRTNIGRPSWTLRAMSCTAPMWKPGIKKSPNSWKRGKPTGRHPAAANESAAREGPASRGQSHFPWRRNASSRGIRNPLPTNLSAIQRPGLITGNDLPDGLRPQQTSWSRHT